MTGKNIVVLIVIIVVLALIAVGISYFVRDEAPLEDGDPDVASAISEPLVVIHSFADGTHTYTVTVEKPTPCHEVSIDAMVAESLPEQITLNLNLVEPREDEICAQVVTQETVDVDVSASEGAELVRVNWDGESVTFEVFEEAKA